MALLDLASRQDFEALQQKLDAMLGLLKRAPEPVDGELMSVEQVAAFTRFDRRTVEKWTSEGEFNEEGTKIYLPAFRFSGRLRFKRAEVEAFGLGVGVLVPSLGAGMPEPVKAASKAKASKKNRAIASEQALRKVA